HRRVPPPAGRREPAPGAVLPEAGGPDPPPRDPRDDPVPGAPRPGGDEAAPGVHRDPRRAQGQAAREAPRPGDQVREVLHPPGDCGATRGCGVKVVLASGKRKTAVARATVTKG